jgi:hypothetical protein
MAPGIVEDIPSRENGNGLKSSKALYPEPLKLSGALEKFFYEESTPVIGREFPNVNIVDDLLHGENSNELLRDLAIISNLFFELARINTKIQQSLNVE